MILHCFLFHSALQYDIFIWLIWGLHCFYFFLLILFLVQAISVMIPPAVKALLNQHPNDPPDTFRVKEHKNHPFLQKIKLEFASNENENSAKTYVHWIDPPSVSTKIFRIQHAYDEDG